MIYTAGQIPIDPATGQVVGTSTAEQTDQVMKNLRAILEAAGSALDNVVKTTVYLADIADFPQMNEVYTKHFGSHKPARSDRKSTRLNSSHGYISYAVFCLKKKKT